jgi:hypothetical protein
MRAAAVADNTGHPDYRGGDHDDESEDDSQSALPGDTV